MTPLDPTTPPPSLSQGRPGDSLTPPPPTLAEPSPVTGDTAVPVEENAAADGPRPKVNYGELFVKNKYLVLGGLVLLLFGGMGWWYMSLTNEMATAAPLSPVSAELNTLTEAPKPHDAGDPISGTEQSLDRDSNKGPAVDSDVMLADGSATAPAGETPPTPDQRADYTKQMTLAARANNTDSVTVTSRDRSTGQFVQKRVAVQRVPVATSQPRRAQSGDNYARNGRPIGNARPNYYTGPTNGGFSGVTPGNQAGSNQQAPPERPRPKYDTDGVAFETNDEINLMISSLPDEVKATYEKMSGKRFRPLLASTQASQQSDNKDRRAQMAYVPGMDGFNTIRFRGSNSGLEEEEALIPDLFYRCSVQGDQLVKSGTVVVLRLTEDATFNGITFPRNMLFSAMAFVDVNRVNLTIDRLGPHRVKVQTYNYAYMPGIMIDPGKRAPAPSGDSFIGGMQQSGTQELSNAIAQSQQAANSLTGVAGRMAVSMIARIPRAGRKLREVSLPDGYPLLLSSASTSSLRQSGGQTAGGLMGQEGNPFQSLLMSGQGQGGYMGNQGVVPPMYYPAQSVQQAQQGVRTLVGH